MNILSHILKFVGLVAVMYALAAFVPYGHCANAVITVLAYWALTK